MKHKFIIIPLIFFSWLCNISVQAQNVRTITGRVTDSENNPLISVTIMQSDKKHGTVTDINGNYSITLNNNIESLIFSYIGYSIQTVEINDRKIIDIVLKEEASILNELIVVGYGTVRRSDQTGSISSVKADDLPKAATTTVAQMLKGQVAGMSFNQWSSQPGAKVSMQIRGAAAGAAPLVVIDGFPMNTMSEPSSGVQFLKGDKEDVLDNINPEDIQDIQILKDASATSIYGSRAAGGVILITTKRGSGEKTNITLKSSYTLQTIQQKPMYMNAREFMTEVNKVLLENYVANQGYYPWGNRSLPSYNDLITEFMTANSSSSLGGFRYDPNTINQFNGGTDWMDAVTRNGEMKQHDLSVTGGSGKTRYLLSLGFMGNEGIAKNHSYSRTTGRLNLDQEFNKWIKGGITLSYATINSNDIAMSGTGDAYDVFRAARSFDPTLPVYNEDGTYAKSPIVGYGTNPVSILDVSMQGSKEDLLTTGYLEITPISDLIVRGMVGYNRKIALSDSYIPSTTYEGENVNGRASKILDAKSDFLFNIIATYNKKINMHNFSIMGGWEYQKTTSDGFMANNTGFPYDGVKWNNLGLGTAERPGVSSWGGSNENASVISRFNYTYDNRYLLTLNYRMDGSSNFAPNKQWGHFGGGSFAWRISEETFLKDNTDWLSNLKLRLGAGITGYAGNLTDTESYYSASGFDYYFNNKPTSGIGLKALGNPDLSWESQSDINIGLDFGFFNNKLFGSVDLYERTVYDRIGYKNLPSYQEINKLAYNTERIDKTRGIDLSVSSFLVETKTFSWNSSLTFTYYRDMTTKRDLSEVLDINDSYSYHWNDLWYYIADGLVQPGEMLTTQPSAKAGAVRIKDIDGYMRDENGNKVMDENGKPMYLGRPDGIIDNADLVYLGNNTPIPFGWSNNFTYKNFDLNLYIYGKFNYQKTNDYKVSGGSAILRDGSNTSTWARGRMSFDNLDSEVPSIFYNTGGFGAGNYYLENAWFIRFDNLSLGYTIPENITKNICRSIRLYAAVKNLFYITPYKGSDPEFSAYYGYLPSRGFTFGFDVRF